MPRELVWLPGAVRDVARLRDFIQSDNPQAARRAATRIKAAVAELKRNPSIGRPVADAPSFRELLIPFGDGNYVLRYREDGNRLALVRVRHSRESGFQP